jgi:WD40 repeat protein
MLDASRPTAIALGAGGALLATLTSSGQAQVWDVATGTRRQSFGSERRHTPTSIALAPDGSWLATASGYGDPDPVVCIWDTNSGELRHELVTVLRYGLQQLPAGDRIATIGIGQGPAVQIWDTRSWTLLWTVDVGPEHRDWPPLIAPDGTWIVTAGVTSEDDCTLGVWECSTGTLRRSIDVDAERLTGTMAIAPDGGWLAVGVVDQGKHLLQVWDTETWTLRTAETNRPGAVIDLIAAPDGTWVVTNGRGPEGPAGAWVDIWDGATWALLRSIDTGHPRGAGLVAVSPDHRWLATAEYDIQYDRRDDAGDGIVRLWDAATGELRGTIDTGHPKGVGTMRSRRTAATSSRRGSTCS